MKQVTQNFRLLGEQVLDIEKKACINIWMIISMPPAKLCLIAKAALLSPAWVNPVILAGK